MRKVILIIITIIHSHTVVGQNEENMGLNDAVKTAWWESLQYHPLNNKYREEIFNFTKVNSISLDFLNESEIRTLTEEDLSKKVLLRQSKDELKALKEYLRINNLQNDSIFARNEHNLETLIANLEASSVTKIYLSGIHTRHKSIYIYTDNSFSLFLGKKLF